MAIPTFRRPRLLRRAVDSVLAQTGVDWELVVSDDEPEPGEAWRYLADLARRDSRVRAVRNGLGRGQVGNTNNALLRCTRPWIKLLDDDDYLLPGCLARLAAVAARFPGAVGVACASHRELGPSRVARYRRGSWPAVEVIPGRQVVRALYLLEDAGHPRPSQIMVRSDTVGRGVLYEGLPGVVLGNDMWYVARVAALGDWVVLREPLVVYSLGGHGSLTSGFSWDGQDADTATRVLATRELAAAQGPVPAAAVTRDAVLLVRGLWRLRQGAIGQGLRVLLGKHPLAYVELLRWVAHRLSGGRYSRIPRRRLPAHPRSGTQR